MTDNDFHSIQQSLLRTKIVAPKLPKAPVSRGRLLERLLQLKDHSLVLLVSAGGFGKTTLLSQMAHALRAEQGLVGWLSVDENDVDIWQLLRYVGLALNRCDPAVGQEVLSLLMPGAPTVSVPLLLRSLVNDLAASPHEITLILDDLHLSPCRDFSQAVEFLVLHAPHNFRIVVGTRCQPALALAKLRARDVVAELSEADLRFTEAESREFLQRLGRKDLTSEECSVLHAGAEGWAAGLQLACISLHNGQSATDLAERMAMPRGVVGMYLAEDILNQQAPDVVAFLLKTSVAERLCPDMCAALTGSGDGQAMLDRVRQLNLFLSPFENEPSWYRYHGLFRKFLQTRLQADDPDLFAELHRRACDWLAGHGLTAEAVRHALACGDQERAADLVEACGMALVHQSETARLLRLTEQLRPAVVASRPHLQLAVAWALALTRNPGDAVLALERLENSLAASPAELRRDLGRRIEAVRATAAAIADDSIAARQLSSDWLKGAGAGEDWECAVMSNVLAFALVANSEFTAANNVYYDHKSKRRQIYSSVYGDVVNGLGYRIQGRLHDAANRFKAAYDNACREAGAFSAAAVLSGTCLAEIRYEWNDVEDVRRLLQGRLDFIDDIGFVGCVTAAYVPLIRLSGLERPAETLELIERLELLGRTRLGGQRMIGTALAERVRFHLAMGDAISAAAALRELDLLAPATAPASGGQPLELWEERQLGHARFDLFSGRADAALGRLLPLIEQTEGWGRYGKSVVMRSLAVLAADTPGHEEAALAAFWDLLSLAGPHSFCRSLLDEGPAMHAVIARATKARPAHATQIDQRRHSQLQPYLRRLTEFVQQAEPPGREDPSLYSILTSREIEVLSAVAAGQSNKEIARLLKLTPETVKWHMKSILSKLQAGNRTQAVRRAYDLGLMVG